MNTLHVFRRSNLGNYSYICMNTLCEKFMCDIYVDVDVYENSSEIPYEIDNDKSIKKSYLLVTY